MQLPRSSFAHWRSSRSSSVWSGEFSWLLFISRGSVRSGADLWFLNTWQRLGGKVDLAGYWFSENAVVFAILRHIGSKRKTQLLIDKFIWQMEDRKYNTTVCSNGNKSRDVDRKKKVMYIPKDFHFIRFVWNVRYIKSVIRYLAMPLINRARSRGGCRDRLTAW